MAKTTFPRHRTKATFLLFAFSFPINAFGNTAKSKPTTKAAQTEQKLQPLNLGNLEPVIKVSESKLTDAPPSTGYPFPVRQEDHYEAFHITSLSTILVGHCIMRSQGISEIHGKPALRFHLEAVSAKWYEWAFIVRDYVSGYFDLKTNDTYFLEVKKREGSYRQHQTVLFDYQQGRVVEKSTRIKKRRIKSKNTEKADRGPIKYEEYNVDKYWQYPLRKGVVDPYSIVYLIRRKDLKVGLNIQYDIYAEGWIYELHSKVVSKETIDHYGKKIETFKIKMLTKVKGALEQRGGIYLFFTADPMKKLIRVEGDVAIGKFALVNTWGKP